MAWLGRETRAEQSRADDFRQWTAKRSGFSLFSCLVGIIALFDFFTVFIGLALGMTAIILAVLGLRDINRRPKLLGRRLSYAGLILGCFAIIASLIMGYVYYFYLPAGG